MAVAFDLTQAVMDEAERRGVPITPEQAAAEAARVALGRTPPAESRTDGAPEVDLSDLTPQSYYDSMDRRGRQLENGGPSNPLPGQPGWTEDSEILAYEPGMTDAEYAAAKANRMHRERMLRGMGPDPGGYTAFNPQQPMWLGTAEDQAQWSQYLANNPEAQRRYDPASYAANRAAEEQAAANAHAARLEERYGPDAAAAYLESQRTGKPMDMNMVRTGGERKDIEERRYNELSARSGGSSGADARRLLEEQDERSGYSGAMGGARVSGKWAVGDGPDGTPEAKYQRFARKTKERQDELDARKLALRNQRMLAGDNPANNMANAYTLMGDPFGDGLTKNQRRALEYMLPSGRLAAEVDARNMEEAASLAARGLQSVLLPTVMQDMQGGDAVDPILGGSNGSWRTAPGGKEAMERLQDTFGTEQEMADFLQRDPYNYPQGEAEAAAAWAFSWY